MENGVFTILDTKLTPDLILEGISREFVSKVQQLRKQQELEMMDNIKIRFSGDSDVVTALNKHKDYIETETLAVMLKEMSGDWEEYDLNGHKTGIFVEKVIGGNI